MPILVDDTGIHVPAVEDVLIDKLAAILAVFGDDTSLSPATPQAQIAGVLAIAEMETDEAIAALGASWDIDRATGAQLDALGSLLGVTRAAATHSTVAVTLTGVAAVNVPAGSRVATATGAVFTIDADTVLSPAGVSTDATAADPGPVEAAAATITSIVTPVAGWETVTNPAAAIPGINAETDAEYRDGIITRAARTAQGPLSALRAALADAGDAAAVVVENSSSSAVTSQQFLLRPHSIAVVASADAVSSTALRRAVEGHRAMGAATMTAIRGGAPDDGALDSINAGEVVWNGHTYTGLDLTSAATAAAKAAALTTLLASDDVPPTVVTLDGLYVAFIEWHPDRDPRFGGDVADDYALTVDAGAAYPSGPFVRARPRALEVTVAVTRASGFPGDGLQQITSGIHARVRGYGIGETLWLNDLLVAAETVLGTRVTSITATHASTAVSGVAPPLDSRWALAADDLTVTIT